MIDKKEGSINILRKNKLIRKSLALLLALSMFLPSGIYRNAFAEGTASVEFAYDLSEINGTKEVEEGQSKKFTVTAKLKDVSEVLVAGLSFQYDKDKLTASSEGKDVETYDSYQSGIWKATQESKNDDSNGVITYEAYVDTNCPVEDKSSEENYTITNTNGSNKVFSSTGAGYDFVTFTFTLKDEEDIDGALKSVKLNADVAEPAYTGYYEDGILLADGKEANKEVDYTEGNSGIVKLTLNKVYSTSSSTWDGTRDFYIAKGTTFETIKSKLPDFGLQAGQGIIGWSSMDGGEAILGTEAFDSDTTIYAKLGNYITFKLDGGSAGEDVTITPQLVETVKTFKDLLIAAGFKDESGEYAAPTKTHYDFVKWTYGADNADIGAIETTNPEDKVYELKANWTPTKYTIAYELDGGTNDEGNPASYNVECGDNGTLTLAEATKTGHTFTGWYTEADGAGTGTKITDITKDNIDALLSGGDTITLYASFDINKYSVTEPTDSDGYYTISDFAITGPNYEEGQVEYSTSADISFTITLDESCNQSTPNVVVKIGEGEQQADAADNENGTFSVTCNGCTIDGAVSFEITGVDKNTYSVTLPSDVTGATLAAAEAYNESSVEHGKEFKFTLTLEDAYNQNTPLVKLGDDVLEAEHSDGTNVYTYTIDSVTSDITNISVEPLEKNTYSITLAGANEDIYFTTDATYGTKKDSETTTPEHDTTYTFYVKYTNEEGIYKGYKVKVGDTYLSDNNNTGEDKTIFTADHTFTTEAITADTTIEIEPVYNCAIKVVFREADSGADVEEESYSIQAAIADKILEKLKDETYQTKLAEFLDKYGWLSNEVSYKLEDNDVTDDTTVDKNEIITIIAQFKRAKYVIQYTGATFKAEAEGANPEKTQVTQYVSIDSGDQDISLLSRTNIDPTSNIAAGKMFKGWKYEGKDAPTNTADLSSIKLFTAGPEFSAEWVNLGDFDEDNNITLADLARLLQSYGSEENKIEDMDCSGKVNALDLAILLKVFGTVYPNTTDAETSTD